MWRYSTNFHTQPHMQFYPRLPITIILLFQTNCPNLSFCLGVLFGHMIAKWCELRKGDFQKASSDSNFTTRDLSGDPYRVQFSVTSSPVSGALPQWPDTRSISRPRVCTTACYGPVLVEAKRFGSTSISPCPMASGLNDFGTEMSPSAVHTGLKLHAWPSRIHC